MCYSLEFWFTSCCIFSFLFLVLRFSSINLCFVFLPFGSPFFHLFTFSDWPLVFESNLDFVTLACLPIWVSSSKWTIAIWLWWLIVPCAALWEFLMEDGAKKLHMTFPLFFKIVTVFRSNIIPDWVTQRCTVLCFSVNEIMHSQTVYESAGGGWGYMEILHRFWLQSLWISSKKNNLVSLIELTWSQPFCNLNQLQLLKIWIHCYTFTSTALQTHLGIMLQQ